MALRISEGTLEGRGLRIAIVASHFTPELTRRLVDGALRVAASAGIPDSALHLVNVPGAFELPMAAEELARQGTSDAIVCVGCVIRGETAHFDYVAGEAARGIARVARSHHLPVTLGVITAENREQAEARAGGAKTNMGADAMAAAIRMATLYRTLGVRRPPRQAGPGYGG